MSLSAYPLHVKLWLLRQSETVRDRQNDIENSIPRLRPRHGAPAGCSLAHKALPCQALHEPSAARTGLAPAPPRAAVQATLYEVEHSVTMIDSSATFYPLSVRVPPARR